MNVRVFLILALAAVVLMVGAGSLYVVSETQRGVLLRFGRIVNADIQPGLHVKWPLVEDVRRFDARIMSLDAPPERFLTLEKKSIIVDSYAKWRITDVAQYYTATGGDEMVARRLLEQRINEAIRNQFAQRTLREVVSAERDELMTGLITQINEFTRKSLGIDLVDVRIKRIDLPAEVSGPVFRRMAAEREEEAREYRAEGKEQAEIIRATADRKQTVILAQAYRDAEMMRGEGDAEAARIYAEAYTKDPEFYSFLRSLNAYQESFDGQGDVLLIDPDSAFFQYFQSPDATP